MKTILQFKKLLIIPLLLIMGNVCLGQTTYTGFPTNAGDAVCPERNESCGSTIHYGKILKANVYSINGNSIVFRVRKCDNSTFQNAGTLRVMNTTICGTQATSVSLSAGITFKDITLNVNHTGKYNYRIVLSSGSTYYTNEVSVTGSAAQPNLVCGNFSVSPSSPIQGQNASFSYSISNTGSGSYNGTLAMWWRSTTTGSLLGTQISSLAAGASHTFTHNSTPLTSPAGNYVLSIEKPDGSVICSKTYIVTAPQPNLSCGTANVNPTSPVQGQNATFNFPISNSGTGAYSGTLKLMWRNATLGFPLQTYTSGISAGGSYTMTATSTPVISDPGVWYLSVEDASGNIIGNCRKTVTVVAAPVLVPNLSCGTANVNPTSPIQGQNATFSFPISNTGTGRYSGTLKLMWRNATLGFPLQTYTSGISAGGSYTMTATSTPVISDPGVWYLSVEDASGNIIGNCRKTVTVVAAPVLVPNLSCGTANVNPTSPIQGQNATFSFPISNTGTGRYSGTLKLMWRNATLGFPLQTYTSGISAGGSYTMTATSTPVISDPGVWYLSVEDASGNIIGNCRKTVTVVAAPVLVPNLELTQCIGYTQFPNTVQGSTVNTDLKLKNTGTGAFNGTLYLSLHSSSGAYIMDLATWTGVSIAANGAYNSTIKTSPTITQAIGNGYRIYAKSSPDGSKFTTISKGTLNCDNFFIVNIIAPTSTPTIPTNGLVAYYPFNGNANDESGNNNHGVVNGAKLTTDRKGNIRNAYQFGGFSNPNYISVAKSNSLQFESAMTVSAFVKINNTKAMDGYGKYVEGGVHTIFSKQGDRGGQFSGTVTSSIAENSASAFLPGLANNTFSTIKGSQLNLWIHLVYVIKTTQASIYMNGQLIKTELGNVNFSAINTANLYFGRFGDAFGWGTSGWYPLDGELDDIRIYNRALSTKEIEDIYFIEGKQSLSVSQLQPNNSLKVYPNPFKDYLNIQTNEDNLQSLKIIDLQGRLIKQEKVSGSSYELNLENLPQATYILEIISDNAKQSIKVIKK